MNAGHDFALMARYNRWMNRKLYGAIATRDDERLREDQGAFFGSVLGTLNHLFVTDVFWLRRFSAHPHGFPSLNMLPELPADVALDTMVHPGLAGLDRVRRSLDRTIVEFAEELTDDALATALVYSNSKGERFENDLGALLMHFFNHQTHHRGQVTTLLSQQGIDIGVTDLVALIREESA